MAKNNDPGLMTMKNSPRHNHSTLIPAIYEKHGDLITSNDELSGITDANEWNEIWKFSKVKEQEELKTKRQK